MPGHGGSGPVGTAETIEQHTRWLNGRGSAPFAAEACRLARCNGNEFIRRYDAGGLETARRPQATTSTCTTRAWCSLCRFTASGGTPAYAADPFECFNDRLRASAAPSSPAGLPDRTAERANPRLRMVAAPGRGE